MRLRHSAVSVLFNEPKLLKLGWSRICNRDSTEVSVLFNEPKLLKSRACARVRATLDSFSALQRAEIAEMVFHPEGEEAPYTSFSALQRAEIAEIDGGGTAVGDAH